MKLSQLNLPVIKLLIAKDWLLFQKQLAAYVTAGIFAGVAAGADTFDCVMPTRVARNGAALSEVSAIRTQVSSLTTNGLGFGIPHARGGMNSSSSITGRTRAGRSRRGTSRSPRGRGRASRGPRGTPRAGSSGSCCRTAPSAARVP